MHLDDTPIKFLTEIIVLGKLLKEVVWSKPARRAGRFLLKKGKHTGFRLGVFFKKISSVPLEHLFFRSRFLKKSESRRRPVEISNAPVVISAAAGSGKTHQLIQLAALLHDLGHSPLQKKLA